jgi:serine/threonine-protein kinase
MGMEVEHIDFGDYLLSRKLAHGGMAEVFLGRRRDDPPDAPPVVVKCILPELTRDHRFLAMFVNEAQLASQMDHPNLVKVRDFGEVGGRLYMAMEYVDGLDCWRFSRRMHPWGEHHADLAVFIIREMLAGLHYAHRLTDVNGYPMGVVHRDLSPSNIYLSLAGAVKLGDFGIARILSDRYRPIEIIPRGKFGYMAPEQVEGKDVDARADVFSAGVVLAEILIGQRLYAGNSQLSVMLDIRDGRLDILEQNAGRIPAALLAVLRRALALSPADRWSSAAEFSDALGDCLQASHAAPSASALGEQVARATRLTDPRSSVSGLGRPSKTPVTADVEPSFRDSRWSPISTDGLLEISPIADLAGTPITAESRACSEDGRYLAILEDSTMVGPTSYAHVVELIYSDRLGPETMVSVSGRDFVPAQELPDLARHLPAFTPTEDVADVRTPERRGFFESEPPAEVALSLALKEETGLLVAQHGKSRKEVYFKGGVPVYVGSNDAAELLGEFMVRSGRLERMELEMALALLPKFNGHFGDTLVALGMVTAIDLFGAIGDQIRTRLTGLLGWRSGTYEFYRGVAVRPGVLEIPIDPFLFARDHLLAAARRTEPDTVARELAGGLIGPRAVTAALAAKMRLPDDAGFIVNSLDAWRTIGDLFASAAHDPGSIAKTLYLAIESGLWAFDGPAPPWRAPSG